MKDLQDKLIEAVDNALDVWATFRRTGRPAQGGEQEGNLEDMENAYDRLKYALQAYNSAR